MSKSKSVLLPLGLLIAAFLALVLYVSPLGDFPLNDDWAYARSVEHLLETGQVKILGWAAPSLVFQVFWGALFSRLFGFSFVTLRISTLTLGLAGGIAFFFTLKELRFSNWHSFLGVVLLLFNPLYAGLSFSFMTDVPFMALFLIALFFYLKGTTSNRPTLLILGSALASLSLLVRQIGILLPVAFAIQALLAGQGAKERARRAGFVLGLPLVALIGYLVWYHAFHGVPPELAQSKVLGLHRFSGVRQHKEVILRGFYLLEYFGFFFLPVVFASVVPFLRSLQSQAKKVAFRALGFWGFLLGAGVGYFALRYSRLMPYMNNILSDFGNFGMGPHILRDAYLLEIPLPTAIPRTVWWLVTLLAALSGMIFASMVTVKVWPLVRWLKGLKHKLSHPVAPLFLATFAFWALFSSLNFVYDRYAIFLLPASIVALLWCIQGLRRVRKVAILALVFLGVFSATFTRDYMQWNRARWSAIHYLTEEKGVPPEKIDAGLEFGGYFNYGKPDTRPERKDKSWWFVHDDEYVVSFSVLPGYRIDRRFPYSTPASFSKQYIYALHREKAPEVAR